MIGVNSFGKPGGELINYAVSSNEVALFLKSPAQSTAQAASASSCEATVIFDGFDSRHPEYARIVRFDRNCDGQSDAAELLPKAKGSSVYLILDQKFQGTTNALIVDREEDSKWDISGHGSIRRRQIVSPGPTSPGTPTSPVLPPSSVGSRHKSLMIQKVIELTVRHHSPQYAQCGNRCLQSANSGHKPLHRRLLSSELALRGSAFSFGPGLPVRIVSECDREAQERGQHQPQIEHIDCAHAGIS